MIHVGVVGHYDRQHQVDELGAQVDADFVCMDDGALGCRANHVNAWNWHAAWPAEWAVVLEDDAIPVAGFRDQLSAVLAVAPAPIVSLYLGYGYIYDRDVKHHLDQAEIIDANWIVTGRVLHAVGLAIRGELVESLLAALPRDKTQAIDRSVSLWARRAGHEVAYTIPSLVDHRDDTSLVLPHRRRSPRKAWKVGGRKQWNTTSIAML